MIKTVDNKIKVKKTVIHSHIKKINRLNNEDSKNSRVSRELIEQIFEKISNIKKQAFMISEVADEFAIYKEYLPDELAILKYRLALVEKDLQNELESIAGALKGADPTLYDKVTKKMKQLESL